MADRVENEPQGAYTFASAAARVNDIADWLGGNGVWWDLHDDLRRCAEALQAAAEGRYKGNPLPPGPEIPETP